MTSVAPVRVRGRGRLPVVVLREMNGDQYLDKTTSIEMEFEDGTFIGFLHLRTESEGVVMAYFELSDEVEEVGVPRAGVRPTKFVYVQRKATHPDA